MASSSDIYTASLGVVAVLTYAWIVIAAYHLPPRGVDDLAYHLPPIFEYVQSHAIRLLPVELHQNFAFPEDAELLYMWPIMFVKNQRMIGSLNVPFVIMSVLTVYALLRFFDISGKDSLFVSIVYALCPVVIMQAGVNYIDVVLASFFLLSLYFSLLFHSERRIVYLFAAGLSIGLMVGIKYTAIVLALPLQFLIIPGLFRLRKWSYSAGYVVLVMVMCGWWYIRNLVVLNDPFFPLNLLGPVSGKFGGGSLINNLIENIQNWMPRYLVDDSGVGTYDGGFGLIFWGMGFSSWLYYSAYLLLRADKRSFPKFIVQAYLPVGFILLLVLPEAYVRYAERFSIFVVAIGLFSLCQTMNVLKDRHCIAIIKCTCVVLSLVTVSLMFESDQPSYKLTDVVRDRMSKNHPSEYKYLMNALPTQAALRFIWEPLDFLTRDDDIGLNCYIVSDPRLFAAAPVYGTRLQNRVIYSYKDVRGAVDAYIYTYYPITESNNEQSGAKRMIPPNIRVNDTMSSYDILMDSDYFVISHSNNGCLILRKSIFRNPDKQRLLLQYYRSTWPDTVILAERIAPLLSEDIPIITSNRIGYGLRYIDMIGQRAERTMITPESMEDIIASGYRVKRCYTLDRPLTGYNFTRISHKLSGNSMPDIYLNVRL